MKDLYITVMFPYPSGEGLHVGHWYNYSIIDSYCKIQKFLGNSVFQPFGFDAFGLPAENYARKVGGDPAEITTKNIESFREEMKRMQTSFLEMVITSSPEYQLRTQELFRKLYNKGLAYKADREQNYCPSCETVLAKEQSATGKCNRCDSTEEGIELDTSIFYDKVVNYFQSWKVNKVVSEWMIFFNNNKNKIISKKTANKLIEFFNTCF